MTTILTESLKSQLRALIGESKLLEAIELAKKSLPEHSPKRNIFIQLERSCKDLQMATIQGVIDFEQQQRQSAKITSNLLSLTDIIEEEDFAALDAGVKKKVKTGNVLYSIPPMMESGEEEQCIVRLAFDEELLKEKAAKGAGVHIQELRKMDNNMEVEIVDPSESGVFAIRTISSKLQFVELDDYTEWLFYVKPLKEGKFPLFLKVSIITKDDGEKVRKELVLQELIEVVAKPKPISEQSGVKEAFVHSGFVFFFSQPILTGQTQDPSSSPSRSPSSLSRIASRVLLGAASITAVFLIVKQLTSGTPAINPAAGQLETSADTLYVPADKMAILPPLEGVIPAVWTNTLDPLRDTVLWLPSGTSIEIPGRIFVDENNLPVLSPVEIRYSEYLTPDDIIASGIPMKVRTRSRNDEWFETAGMCNIEGFSQGKPVFIAKGKSIDLKLRTPFPGDYATWYFEADKGNWRKTGEAATGQPAQMSPEMRDNLAKEIAKLRLATAKPPTPPDKTGEKFNNSVSKDNLDEFPELRGKRNIVWYYAGKDPNLRPSRLSHTKWNQELEAGPKPGQYWMVMKSDYEKVRLLVTLEAEVQEEYPDYEKLLEEYNQKMALLKAKEDQFQEERKSYTRQLNIRNFGVHNCDIFFSTPNAIAINADFDFGDKMDQKLKDLVTVYYVSTSRQVVVGLSHAEWSSLRVDAENPGSLTAILPNNKVATFTKEDFKAAMPEIRKSEGKPYSFKMKVRPASVKTLPDLEKTIIATL